MGFETPSISALTTTALRGIRHLTLRASMATPARPASLLLITPACVPGSFPADGSFDFTRVDTLQAVRVPDQDSAHYSVDISQVLSEGKTRVCRGTLSVDGCRQSDVVCKIGHGRQLVDRLRKEADLYQGRLASLQGQYVPTFIGCFEGTTEAGETACLVLTYEGDCMEQSLYISCIELR